MVCACNYRYVRGLATTDFVRQDWLMKKEFVFEIEQDEDTVGGNVSWQA